MPFVRVADDRRGFVLEGTGERFVPWGFNYDHDEQNRLIEDYWETEWDKVVEDFGEMRALGANVVRIHIQLGKFMETAEKPDQASLDRLAMLLDLAERERLYVDLTGLGCYHKRDVPEWYDPLPEADRWKVQGRFWEAVARVCADSPALFFYDLMNEPTAAGGKGKATDWLGPAFGGKDGKHFVQRINLKGQGRTGPEIAKQWIGQLVAAIRKHDRRHLISVGFVDWSLPKPGKLFSGFDPAQVSDPLDFLCIHLYPERGKVDEALETLAEFAKAGKPVIIEETFPLKAGHDEFEQFLDRSRAHACGWISFYWGKTREEYARGKTIGDALMKAGLDLLVRKGPEMKKAR
jgi:hypothetical protein